LIVVKLKIGYGVHILDQVLWY